MLRLGANQLSYQKLTYVPLVTCHTNPFGHTAHPVEIFFHIMEVLVGFFRMGEEYLERIMDVHWACALWNKRHDVLASSALFFSLIF